MKKSFRILLLILLLIAIAIPFFGPSIVEETQNRVRIPPPYAASKFAMDLHKKLLIADLHADSLLWKRDLLQKGNRGQVDIPRLIEGNVALQAFTVVTKTPFGLNIQRNDSKSDSITLLAIAQLWPIRTWSSLKERALFEASKLHSFAERSNGKFVIIRNRAELTGYLKKRQRDQKITAGLLGIEGAQALEGNLANLQTTYDAGFRMIAPTHFFDNEIGGSAHGVNKGGLTPLGKQMIEQMEQKQMIVDLAHASPRLIDDVLAMATRPVVISHTGVKGTCNNIRNLSDDQVRGIAMNGGLIGIGYWNTAVCGTDPEAIARAIRYAVNVAGINHVALGSDFDGAVTVPFDSSGLVMLTQALISEGFSDSEIKKIMGENTISFFLENLP